MAVVATGRMPFCLACVVSLVTAVPSESASIVRYPAPLGEPASEYYKVYVNGESVFVYTSHMFDATVPYPTPVGAANVWGRPVSPVSFAYFDMSDSGSVKLTVAVNSSHALGRAPLVRPLRAGIWATPGEDPGTFTFELAARTSEMSDPLGSSLSIA